MYCIFCPRGVQRATVGSITIFLLDGVGYTTLCPCLRLLTVLRPQPSNCGDLYHTRHHPLYHKTDTVRTGRYRICTSELSVSRFLCQFASLKDLDLPVRAPLQSARQGRARLLAPYGLASGVGQSGVQSNALP
jgi:hypothetical protein